MLPRIAGLDSAIFNGGFSWNLDGEGRFWSFWMEVWMAWWGFGDCGFHGCFETVGDVHGRVLSISFLFILWLFADAEIGSTGPYCWDVD